jgi:chromate transporter
LRAGVPGAVCAWLDFTIPSALAIILWLWRDGVFGSLVDSPWLYGLKIVAVAVVAQVV